MSKRPHSSHQGTIPWYGEAVSAAQGATPEAADQLRGRTVRADERGFAAFQALFLAMRRWERAGVLNPEELEFVLQEAGRSTDSRRLLFELCEHAAPASEGAFIASYFVVHAAALQMAAFRQPGAWKAALRIAVAEVLQHTFASAVLASGLTNNVIDRARGLSANDVVPAHSRLLARHYQLGAHLGFPARLRRAPEGAAPVDDALLGDIIQKFQSLRSDLVTMADALSGRPAWRALLHRALVRTSHNGAQAPTALPPEQRETLFRFATLHMLKDASLTA